MDSIHDFLNYLQYEKRYSSHTVVSYQNDLTQFEKFCLEFNISESVESANSKTVRSWILYLVENNISSRSVNRKITSLNSFYKFLIREERIKTNPLEKVNTLKIKKRLPTFVEEKQMNVLLDDVKYEEGFTGIRNAMIIETFYQTGIRLSELINLKVSDIDTYYNTIKVLGKRNKERIIPISPEFQKKIIEFIDLRKESNQSAVDYLFTGNKGNKLNSVTVYRIVKKYLSLVTTSDKKSPHVLRHTFATQMLNHGADLNAIKELLGHANLSATQVYTHNTFEKLTKIYKQAHPRA